MKNAANLPPNSMIWGAFFGFWGYLEGLWSFLGAPDALKRKKNNNTLFQRPEDVLKPLLWGLLGHLGIQDRAKILNKTNPKWIENLMPLGIGVVSDFIEILAENEGKLAPKIDPKNLNLK